MDDTRKFLRAHYENKPEDTYVSIWQTPLKRTKRFKDIEKCAKFIEKIKENPLEFQSYLSPSVYSNPYKLQNEIGVLKSKELTKRALKELNFEVSYFIEEKFVSREIFGNCPFIIEFDSLYDQPLNVKFQTTFLSDTIIKIDVRAEKTIIHNFRKQINTKYLDYFEYSDTIRFGEDTLRI